MDRLAYALILIETITALSLESDGNGTNQMNLNGYDETIPSLPIYNVGDTVGLTFESNAIGIIQEMSSVAAYVKWIDFDYSAGDGYRYLTYGWNAVEYLI